MSSSQDDGMTVPLMDHGSITALTRYGWFRVPDNSIEPQYYGVHSILGEADRRREWKEAGCCPKCGELGPYIRLQAVCSKHGPY